MKILTRMCTSLDGCVTTAEGLPIQLAFPEWDAGALGFYELQERCDAVLMGRTTFEPALGAPFWPGDLAVYVLSSHRVEGSPDHVVFDADRRASWSECATRVRAARCTWSADHRPLQPFWPSVPSVSCAFSFFR